jgi:hypothetical protein
VFVGSAYVSETKAVVFRWDAMSGMVNLGTFDADDSFDSVAYSVSADGRTIIGWDYKERLPSGQPNGLAMNGTGNPGNGKDRLLHAFGWAGEAGLTNDLGSIIVGRSTL